VSPFFHSSSQVVEVFRIRLLELLMLVVFTLDSTGTKVRVTVFGLDFTGAEAGILAIQL